MTGFEFWWNLLIIQYYPRIWGPFEFVLSFKPFVTPTNRIKSSSNMEAIKVSVMIIYTFVLTLYYKKLTFEQLNNSFYRKHPSRRWIAWPQPWRTTLSRTKNICYKAAFWTQLLRSYCTGCEAFVIMSILDRRHSTTTKCVLA